MIIQPNFSMSSGGTPPKSPLQQEIDRLEQVRDLFKATGNNSTHRQEIDGLIALRRQQLGASGKGPRKFGEAEMEAIRASLAPGCTTIANGVPTDLVQPLQDLRSLVDQGVQLVDAKWKDLEPVDAFVRLMEVPFHGPDEQIMFKSYGGGGIMMSTLRPEYLGALRYYADKTRDGVVFYAEKKGEHVRIDTPHEFTSSYGREPAKALVKAIDGSFLPLDEARKRDVEWSRKLTAINEGINAPDAPKVTDLGDSVSIGGIVIRKRGQA